LFLLQFIFEDTQIDWVNFRLLHGGILISGVCW